MAAASFNINNPENWTNTLRTAIVLLSAHSTEYKTYTEVVRRHWLELQIYTQPWKYHTTTIERVRGIYQISSAPLSRTGVLHDAIETAIAVAGVRSGIVLFKVSGKECLCTLSDFDAIPNDRWWFDKNKGRLTPRTV